MFVFEFSFIKDEVCKIFNGVLMDIFHEGFDAIFWILRLDSLLMECSCMAPRTPVVIVIRGFVCHPIFRTLSIKGSYLACLCMRACSGNRSWQYVNSINCIVCVGDGSRGVDVWVGTPKILRMSGLSLAWQ